jgi:hypothetical protein
MKSSISNVLKTSVLTCALAVLASCNGGGGGGGYTGGGTSGGWTVGGGTGGGTTVGGGTTGGGTTGGGTTGSSYGNRTSAYVTVDQFVSALNNIESSNYQSYVELYTTETLRSATPGEDDWFVIYDDRYNEHKAVSLQYIRAIVYYDYYSNTTALAREFREIENDDILAGDIFGDYWGDDYEVVDYDYWTRTYVGRNSGFEYEDEAATTDVSLMTAEVQQKEFIKKAANISFAFNVGIETSLSLVTLGEKAEKILGKSNGELTLADQAAFATDLQKLAGVSLADVMAASQSEQAQTDLVERIATKIGTSAANLESRILPELFGVEL